MNVSAGKIQLTNFDDLFQTHHPSEADAEQVQELPLSDLYSFKKHPFKVKDDEKMRETVESIKQYGVLVPGIVRPRPEGGYEIIAGHRRKRGSELAGKTTMPVIVRKLDDDAATIIMVDSNIQRENILPSEKAWAYKMKLEALKHQGERTDLTSARAVPKLSARDQVAQDAGEKSGMAVTRYISLTKLISGLLDLVDEGKISVNAAADYLSGLTQKEQDNLLTVMKENGIPTVGILSKLPQYSKEGKLTKAVIYNLLSEGQPVPQKVTIKADKIKQYFPPTYTARQIEEVIFSLLDNWIAHHV